MKRGSNPVSQFAGGLRTSFPASFLLGLPQINMDRLVLPPLFLMPCFALLSPPSASLEGSKRRFRSYDTHSAGLSPPHPYHRILISYGKCRASQACVLDRVGSWVQ
ncbi:hypothetical protein GW17_00032066 [Ensete ventricosum]|nr:hypothetical protein GW17_00032066 [Ensete ventricosum]